jgi:hypothetical protein
LLAAPLLGQPKKLPISNEVWSEPVAILDSGRGLGRAPWFDAARSGVLTGEYESFLDGVTGQWSPRTKMRFAFTLSSLADYLTISPDAQRLYLVDWGGFGGWDEWVSRWSDSLKEWLPPANLGPHANTQGDDMFAAEVNWAGKRRLLSMTNGIPGYLDWDSAAGDWGRFWPIPASPRNWPVYPVNGLSITADGRRLYYGGNSPFDVTNSKYGGKDLFVCYWDSSVGAFSHCALLAINSYAPDTVVSSTKAWFFGQDAFPSVSPDGTLLFFESTRDLSAPRIGEYPPSKIYMSRLIREASPPWVLVGVDEPPSASRPREPGFSISPQPANIWFEVRANSQLQGTTATVLVWNSSGMLVAREHGGTEPGASARVDVSHLPAGVYAVAILSGSALGRALVSVVH